MHKSFSLPSLRTYTILSLREKRKVKVVVTGELQSSALAQTTEVAVQSVHPRKTSNTAMFPQTGYESVVLAYTLAHHPSTGYPQTQSP